MRRCYERAGLGLWLLLACAGSSGQRSASSPVAAQASSPAGNAAPNGSGAAAAIVTSGAAGQTAGKANLTSPSTAPPPTRREDISTVLHGIRVDDPYRWLEDPKKPEVQSWVQAQNAHARRYLDALPAQAELQKRFAELMYFDAVSPPLLRGGREFFSRRYKDKEKPVLKVRPAGREAEERTLIDPNELSPDGKISLGSWFVSWDGKKVAYTLHENNADEATLYVRDVDTGKDSELDVIPGAKYAHPTWTPDSKGFYYEWLPSDPLIPVAERPGRTELRYHALGSPPAQDPVVFPATGDPETFLSGGISRDGRWLIVNVTRGWNQNDVYVRAAQGAPGKPPAGKAPASTSSPAPASAATAPSTNKPLAGMERARQHARELGFETFVSGHEALFHVFWWNGTFYVHTNYLAPNYRVLAVQPGALKLEQWRELVPEKPAKLDGASVIGGQLVLSHLENASSRIQVHDLRGKHLYDVQLPGIGSASGMVGDPDRDEAYYSFSSFTVPTQVYQTTVAPHSSAATSQKAAGKPAPGTSKLWAQIQLPIDTSKMQVQQTWYESKDGTRISMFVVHRADIALDGSHPALLYGYGGFNVDMTPSFSQLAVVWLEQGGVFALPNLRGGGEYGEAWHRAGMGVNKQNVFDDFAAAARHLISSGYTSSERLAIYGGSNGGLLVGASMVQHPELFRAVVCSVPLLDMVRFHLFGSGKTWVAEYGSPEDPVEFATLYDYSPYHHVLPGVKYPSLLMMAADNDDRVDPMHARKLTAMVQWATSEAPGAVPDPRRPVLMRVEENAGHGGADMVAKRIRYNADLMAFLLDQLRPAK